jgi:hypothetical protein
MEAEKNHNITTQAYFALSTAGSGTQYYERLGTNIQGWAKLVSNLTIQSVKRWFFQKINVYKA